MLESIVPKTKGSGNSEIKCPNSVFYYSWNAGKSMREIRLQVASERMAGWPPQPKGIARFTSRETLRSLSVIYKSYH